MYPIRTEPVACPLCLADDHEPFVEGSDGLHDVPGIFVLVRCRRCTMVYLNPRPVPEQIAMLYPSTYAPHTQSSARSRLLSLQVRRAAEKRAGFAVAFQSRPGAILDVGCGTGDFLLAMNRRGWQTAGVEPSSQAAEVARSHGLVVTEGTLEDTMYPNHCFDLLTMWDVLEHVPEPLTTLREARRVLRPDGLIVISTPDLESWMARVLGSAWAGLDIPRHLSVFASTTLLAAIEKAGFRVVARSYFTGGHASLVLSLRILARRQQTLNAPWTMLGSLASSLPIQIACYPLHRVVAALARGPIVTMVAQPLSSS